MLLSSSSFGGKKCPKAAHPAVSVAGPLTNCAMVTDWEFMILLFGFQLLIKLTGENHQNAET